MTEDAIQPHIFVVLGGTADLARRKILPALFQLSRRGLLPARWALLAVGRNAELTEGAYRDWAAQAIRTAGIESPEVASWCERHLYYEPLAAPNVEAYQRLAHRIRLLERALELPGNRGFYLAVPPVAFREAISGLGQAGLNRAPGWARLVIEKPFGLDLGSARALNSLLHKYFTEEQVYRIDHYLGKETVQNLLVFRFANPIFESLWNRHHVDHVQITVAEMLGMEGRATYYEQVGALRDMVQNHLMQLVALIAMEVPGAFEAEALRREKVKVLRSIRPLQPKDIVRGQYVRGEVAGQTVPGYREEPGVSRNSRTETFVALRLEVANWRWHGVPFYLRTGKRLARRRSEVAVVFKCPPVSIFQPFDSCTIHSNVLVVALQPDEGFDLHFEIKRPGMPLELKTASLHFRYAEQFGEPLPEAYETLLVDVLRGDQMLFVGAEEVEAAWQVLSRLQEGAHAEPEPYPAGSWGPPGADRLIGVEGRAWRLCC